MKRKKQKFGKKLGIFVIFTVFIAILVLAVFLIKRYMPTSEKMSGYTYFDVKDSNDVYVMCDDESYSDVGVYSGERIYLLQSFVEEEINIRFYYDKESNAVLYSDSNAVYMFYPDMKGYNDTVNTYDTDYEVVKTIDGKLYTAFDYVAERSSIVYTYADEPKRLIIDTEFEQKECVNAKKTAAVRYRAGIKSPVLKKVQSGEKLYFVEELDEEWSCVMTEDGFTGYIKSSALGEHYSYSAENTYTESYTPNLRSEKVNLAWFQVTQAAANANIYSYLENVTGLNTISPTWYSIADAEGNLNSLASADFVSNMHARGIQVWPLINDFSKDVDYESLYSSRQARTKLINTLMQEAANYGYDGYNIDFEYVKQAYVEDYLQFLRELSIACHARGLYLSVDNYKPASHNMFYNLKEQSVFVDYIIIMGYDEHYAGSDAGSVASLGFVQEGIEAALAQVPSRQLMNAVPFYTRIWTTNSEGTTSRAVGIQSALNAVGQNGATAEWNEETGQYYATYENSSGTVQIWLEEDRSLSEKMKLYKKYQLGGVAEWKLGLETDSVWSIISDGLQY
jgi:spore germination protein YaaH/outer membrane lipoprotein-sorting protein